MIAAAGLTRASAAVLTFAVLGLAPAAATTPSPLPTATGGRVTLLQSSTASPRARRCLTRVREELAAGGFEVTVGDFGSGEALWMGDAPGPRDESIATIALIGNPDEGPAELWIVDGVPSGRYVVRRLLVPAGTLTHDDEVLAIRALEFLRASAIELARRAPSPTASTPPTPPAPASAAVTATAATASLAEPVAAGAQRAPVSFELGLSLLDSSRTLGPAFLPIARVRAEWFSLLETRITLAGFGTQPRVMGAEGTAVIGQFVGLFELRTAFRHGRAVRPAIGLGAGLLRVGVDANGNWPYEGLRGERWSALFDVGAGLTARLGGRLAVAFEVHGQLAAPYPTLRFSGDEVAQIARPALFSSLTLVTPL